MAVRSGVELRRRFVRSLAAFADFAAHDPRFASVDAIIIRTSACDQFPRSLIEKLAARLGFEIEEHHPSLRERFVDFAFVRVVHGLDKGTGRQGDRELRNSQFRQSQ